MMKYYQIILLFLSFCSCIDKNKTYFHGDVVEIDFQEELFLKSRKVEINDIYTGSPVLCDSFLLFCSSKYPEHYVSAFNVITWEKAGNLFLKGDGPDAYINNINICNIYKGNNQKDSRIWIYDNLKSYRLINLTRSFKTGKTEVDSIIRYEFWKHYKFPFINTHISSKGIICGIQSMEIYNNREYEPKHYLCFNSSFDEPDREFPLYDYVPFDNKNPQIGMGDHCDSYDVIHPSGDKVALAMCMAGHINILDLKTGVSTGYHIKGTPALSEVSTQKEYTAYFTDIDCNENHIYALTADGKKERYPALSNIILVLDWDGNPIKRIMLDKEIQEFTLGDNIIYAMSGDDLYEYKL